MCRCRAVLLSFLAVATSLLAQDSAPPPPAPSPQEKAQASTALAEARNAVFPVRRKDEGREVLTRIATLLAIAGDAAGAQEILTLLPANAQDAIQQQIVTAQLRSGDVPAALQTAAAIPGENTKAAALLLVVQSQATSKDFDGALRTAALIPAGQVASVQALVDVASEQKAAKENSEAAQLLRRAAAAAASVLDSNGDYQCGLSLLTEIAKAQDGLGESADAARTLQSAEGRVPEADFACKAAANNNLQDEAGGKSGALQNQMAALQEKLNPSVEIEANEEQSEEDSSGPEEVLATVGTESPLAIQTRLNLVSDHVSIQVSQLVQRQQRALPREQTQESLDSLRTVKPLSQRAESAIGMSQLMSANGKADAAEEAIRIGLEAADTVQDQDLRDRLLSARAQARAVAKDWEGARGAVEEISDPELRTGALVDIAFRAANNGQVPLALGWANAEASPFSQATVLVAVAEALLHQPHDQPRTIFPR